MLCYLRRLVIFAVKSSVLDLLLPRPPPTTQLTLRTEGGEVRGRGHFLLNWCHFNFAPHIWVCLVFQGWHCLVGISIGLSVENAEQDFL